MGKPNKIRIFQKILLTHVIVILTIAIHAQPVYDLYVCPTSSSLTFINDEVTALKSNDVCNSGTKMWGVPVSDESGILASLDVVRIDDGPHRAQVNIVWVSGKTGVVVIDVYYKSRKLRKAPHWDCEWSNDRKMFTYVIHRERLSPNGSTSGTKVNLVPNDQTNSAFNLSYLPSPSYPSYLNVTKITYFDGLKFVTTGVTRDRTKPGYPYYPTPINFTATGKGFFYLRIQVYANSLLDQCDIEVYDLPTETLEVESSCYLDKFLPDAITIVDEAVSAFEDPRSFDVKRNKRYNLVLKGITDFNGNYKWDFSDFGRDVQLSGNSFSIPADMKEGSYSINVIANASGCPSPDPTSILIDVKNMKMQQTCSITLPADISKFYPDISPDDIILKHTGAYIKSGRSVIIKPGITLELGAEIFIDTPDPGTEEDLDKIDTELNFTQQTAYDEYGRVIASSRSYFDNKGELLQTQYKNLTSSVVLANAVLYDAEGRQAIETLTAPVIAAKPKECATDRQVGADINFTYKPDFIKGTDGKAYNYFNHFDLNKESTPVPVVSTTEGTLGWYYSENNGSSANPLMNEPLVATTEYPYTRVLYNHDGSGTVMGVTKPGDIFKAGSPYLATSAQQEVTEDDIYFNTEFKSYLSIRTNELGLPRPLSIKGQFLKTINTDENGNKSVSYNDRAGHTIIALYYADQSIPLTVSYQFYDNAGRLLVSISPSGLDQYNGSNFSEIDKTRYFYNNKGWLAKLEGKTAGSNVNGISTTKYLYSSDGKIRFSENEEQRNALLKRYTYINYDRSGRIIELGEFEEIANTKGIAFGSSDMMDIINTKDIDGGIKDVTGKKKDRSFTFYDQPDPNIPVVRAQRFVNGNVSYTIKDNSDTIKDNSITTWYSYDELGRVEWMVQYIIGLGTKTLDYRYGPTGQVQEVVYQRGTPNEQFTHFYEYDRDRRLHKVYTTHDLLVYDNLGMLMNTGITYNDDNEEINSPGVLEHLATYSYYLHGPLKRIELATRATGASTESLQGIDYLYTVDGALKSINHSDPTKDPNGDGSINTSTKPDVFGMTFDYYTNDYVGAKTGADNLSTPSTNLPQYSGLIKDIRWHSPVESGKQFVYTYDYDKRNQFLKANWGNVAVSTTNTFIPDIKSGAYIESIGSYDANGNINSLKRNTRLGNSNADFTYVYKSKTNILQSITQNNKTFRSYNYNDVGHMTEETEGDNSKFITYDFTGKVTGVYADAEHKQPITNFKYDDRGFRLKKTTFDKFGDAKLDTWYVRDASGNMVSTYEEFIDVEPLKQTEVPLYGSSRLGMYKREDDITLYEISDHLGNVRAVIGKDMEHEVMASMESERNDKEVREDGFLNIKPLPSASFTNHTPTTIVVNKETEVIENPNESCRLNNKPSPDPIGAGIMFWVHPGDVINAEVFAKYINNETPNSNVLGGIAAFLTTIVKTTTIIDGAALVNAINSPEFATAPAWGKFTDSQPKASLNYVLFDNNFVFDDFDLKQVSDKAKVQGNPFTSSFEKLSLDVTIVKEGFIYIYVSNLSNQNIDVFFDDLRIKHKYSNIVAGGDYYPFGSPIKERQISRDAYRHGYQGQFAEKDDETGWSHFQLREYDATIGRWTKTDPMGQYWSPYGGMGNNPVSGFDADGAYSWLGAWWRSGFSASDVVESGGEYGYYTAQGNTVDGMPGVEITTHFGDERSGYKSNSSWLGNHFEVSANYELSYGLQFGGGWKKNAAAYVDFGSSVRSDVNISNKGSSGGKYKPHEKENQGIGVSYEGVGVDVKRQKQNGQAVTTVSVGALGILAGERSYNDKGELVGWFWGVDVSAKGAVIVGIEGGLRLGFSK